jgi:hypothetical protein
LYEGFDPFQVPLDQLNNLIQRIEAQFLGGVGVKSKTDKELAREKGKIEYAFIVGVDLFSRYAFVKLWKIGRGKGELPESKLDVITERPEQIAEAEAYEADKADDGMANKLGQDQILEAIKEWYKKIESMGFDNVSYFITDDGSEYKGRVDDFIKSQKSIHGLTVPNDRVKNPVAERFIGTFKRLFGQLTAMKGSNDITQDDVKAIVDFYNKRIHSSTGYAPDTVLDGISMKDGKVSIDDQESVAPVLFDFYRHQKGEMYYDLKEELPTGSVVRIYSKWKTPDKNIGDKKMNIANWSFTLYKVKQLNKADNFYLLDRIGQIDPRDKRVEQPSDRGLRREFLLPIDYDSFRKFQTRAEE